MVRGIFCHDLPIYRDINGDYCSTTLTDSVFKRYLSVVDELVVATRLYQLDCTYSKAHQEKITLNHIKFLNLPNLNKPQYIFTRMPGAKKTIRDEMSKCDLVFIRGGIIGLISAKIAKELGKKYLCESAGCAWDEYWHHSLSGKLMAPYMELNAKKNTRHAAYVIYVTEKYLQNRYPTEGVSAAVSDVVIGEINERVLERRIRKIEERKGDQPWVIGTAAGLVTRSKGQQFVIEAISRLKNELNIRYELAGTGDPSYLRSVAEKYGVEDRIVFKGEINHNEIVKWMDTLDTYIQPSMQEGLPRSLVEAMSRGCPCIGSTTGGIPELLDKNALFQRGDINALEKKIREFHNFDWKNQAVRNFNRAKDFQELILNDKREGIFMAYREDVMEGKLH